MSLISRAIYRFVLTRALLRALFGPAFAEERFPLRTLWKCVFFQKVIGFNRHVPWPVHWSSHVIAADKIVRGDRLPGLAVHCYLDGRNGIVIGANTWVGPGVKIISMNHNVQDYTQYIAEDPVRIGRDCWLASNSVILPGVVLGDHTIVAAGAVVTQSFPDGNQILAGVPAKPIKSIPPYHTHGS